MRGGDAGRMVRETHPLQVRSAYGVWGEPACTSFHGGFQGCVDYILFGGRGLKLTTLMPVPPMELLARSGSLPDRVTPSDHLPIAADFEWHSAEQGGGDQGGGLLPAKARHRAAGSSQEFVVTAVAGGAQADSRGTDILGDAPRDALAATGIGREISRAARGAGCCRRHTRFAEDGAPSTSTTGDVGHEDAGTARTAAAPNAAPAMRGVVAAHADVVTRGEAARQPIIL